MISDQNDNRKDEGCIRGFKDVGKGERGGRRERRQGCRDRVRKKGGVEWSYE